MTLTSAETIRAGRGAGRRARRAGPRTVDRRDRRDSASKPRCRWKSFVHGALCVAYSGQCLTSESLGGRSANRGQCAQACRLPYELICDGQDVDLGEQQVSAQPAGPGGVRRWCRELIAAGVCSFKIEGRLKTPEYVANITRHYRQAIDAALAGRPVEFTPRRRRGDGAVVLARLFARLAGRLRSQDAGAGDQLGQARRAAGRRAARSRGSRVRVELRGFDQARATASCSTGDRGRERRTRRPRVRSVSSGRSLTEPIASGSCNWPSATMRSISTGFSRASSLEDRRSGADQPAAEDRSTATQPQRRVPRRCLGRRRGRASRCDRGAAPMPARPAASNRPSRWPRRRKHPLTERSAARATRPAGRHDVRIARLPGRDRRRADGSAERAGQAAARAGAAAGRSRPRDAAVAADCRAARVLPTLRADSLRCRRTTTATRRRRCTSCAARSINFAAVLDLRRAAA